MSSTVPTRSEVPDSDKWDLSHLFIDTSKWQEDFAWLQRTYPKFVADHFFQFCAVDELHDGQSANWNDKTGP